MQSRYNEIEAEYNASSRKSGLQQIALNETKSIINAASSDTTFDTEKDYLKSSICMSEIEEDLRYYDYRTGVWASAPGGTQYKKDLPLMKTKFSDEEQYLYY